MRDNQIVGKVSEFYVMYQMSLEGWDVTVPSGNPRWDAIIQRNNIRLFVQIKGTVRKGDVITADLRGSDDSRYYTASEVDIIAIHDRDDNAVYYVPISEVEGKATVTLRLSVPRNYRPTWTKLASDYTSLDSAILRNTNTREAAA